MVVGGDEEEAVEVTEEARSGWEGTVVEDDDEEELQSTDERA